MAASLGIGVVQLNFGLNMGDYLAWLPRWTFETFCYSQDPATTADWMANWTLFFWAWWVAWAPFVGLLFFVTSADSGALVMATLIMGLPFMVVVYLIIVGLMRSIRMETAQVDSRAIALHSAISGRTLPSGNDLDWENRLDRTSTWPSEQTAHRYVVQSATPARS